MTRKSQKWLEMWGHVSQTLACITNGKYWRRQDAKGILRRLVSQFAVHLVTFVMQNTKPWLTSTEWMAIFSHLLNQTMKDLRRDLRGGVPDFKRRG